MVYTGAYSIYNERSFSTYCGKQVWLEGCQMMYSCKSIESSLLLGKVRSSQCQSHSTTILSYGQFHLIDQHQVCVDIRNCDNKLPRNCVNKYNKSMEHTCTRNLGTINLMYRAWSVTRVAYELNLHKI